MTMQYSKEVMKNFMNPKNLGEIKDADGIGKVGILHAGMLCGFILRLGKKKGKR